MKTCITALNYPQLNRHLRTNFVDRIDIVHEDIMYQEGLFEYLNNNDMPDSLILNINLPGDGTYDYKGIELVRRIREINEELKIIVVGDEDNKEIRNSLYPLGVYDIFISEKADLNQLIEAIESNEKVRIKETFIEVPVNYKVSKEIIETSEIILENAEYRVVTLVSATPSGKTELANNLAHYASEKGKTTALVDIDDRKFEQYYYFDIDEDKIKANYNYKGYNKYNILFNALQEKDIRILPDIAFKHNKNLHIYTGDVDEVNPEIKEVGKLLDRLRSIYNITIVDTGTINNAVLDTISVSDTVLFIHDMKLSSIKINEKILERLSTIANIKKFYLVINMYEKSNVVNPEIIAQYYKNEIGIEFKDVIVIPNNFHACMEGQWKREPAYKIKSESTDFADSIESLYKTLFGGTGKIIKQESLFKKIFKGRII